MKELSIEEKARRYDEAIEIAKEINNEQQAQPFNVMTRVFPELAESEDERIRKALIDYHKRGLKDSPWFTQELKHQDILAWLEKQGEKGTKRNNGEIPNSTWSDEDEEMYKKVETAIDSYYAPFSRDAEEMSEWFKNLKDRVQPQPRKEWSEEDEENFARVDYACLKVYGGDSYSSDWLRKFLGIHKKWKPSDEQMEYLAKAILTLGNEGDCKTASILNELRTDLKKL